VVGEIRRKEYYDDYLHRGISQLLRVQKKSPAAEIRRQGLK
jgi:hypothetical protein